MSDTFSSHLSLHLNTQAPLLWVVSDEPRRVAMAAADATERPVVRMDLLTGAELWDRSEKTWKTIMVTPDAEEERPEGALPTRPIEDLGEALKWVATRQGVFIIENAHLRIEPMINYLTYNARKWLDVFFTDDDSAFGATILMISCKDEVPPELSRAVVKVIYEFPSPADIKKIFDYVISNAEIKAPETNEMTLLTRAGMGLSEFEIIQAANESLVETGKLNVTSILNTKLAKLKTDGLLEVRTPSLSLDQIGGLDQAKKLIKLAAWVWQHPEEAAQLQVEAMRRVMMIGVPGTGKSAMCEAVAVLLGLELVKFGASPVMSKWLGESEQNMRRAFRMIKAMAPLVLWTDELGRDLSGGASSGATDGGSTSRVHGEFLTGIQELPHDVFWMAATNDISALPPEMLRADRMDKILFVGLPTPGELEDIFAIHLGKDARENFDLEKLAKKCYTFTGAEVKALIKDTRFTVAGEEHRRITTADITKAIPLQKARVIVSHPDVVDRMYRQAKDEWLWASSEQEADADRIISMISQAKTKRSKPVSVPASSGGGVVPSNYPLETDFSKFTAK